jgi:putative ABC transport system permease protein
MSTVSDPVQPIETMDSQPRGNRAGWQSSVSFRLAWRNITRDRIRLIIAVIGVAFAVLLMTVQLGLLIGFATISSSLVDNAQADLWIVPRGAKDVDQAGYLIERQKYRALGVSGVDAVQSLIVRFTEWKRPDGGTESVIVVGIDPVPVRPALQPWNFIEGSVDNLRIADGVVIDELYSQKLGVSKVGETVEIIGRRARIVGITSQIRTFTQSPYVFANLKNARIWTGLPDDRTTYLLVQAEKGANLASIRNALQAALPASDVYTSGEFSWRTRIYWLITTGVGAALLIAAVLGVIVGMVIVSQTLYSATMERLQEYATIRAMGATNRYLQTIVLRQSLVSGTLGYVIGTAIALMVAWLSRSSSATLMLSYPLIIILGVITLSMCVGASLISIRKVLRVDTASVFR